jgi:predicted transport protein
MPIFQIKTKKAIPLKEKNFESEQKLQEFIDENLDEFFGLKFIKREFGGQGLSIDTIAYDPETKGPVLIEYKKDTQISVVDQGIAYLDWLLNHKGDYLVLLEEKLKIKDVDWSQTRVIFVAKNYSPHQIRAAGMQGIPFELWRYDLYENLFNIQMVETPKSDVSFSSLMKSSAAKKISKEIKKFSIEDHLQGRPKKLVSVFKVLREKILAIDNEIKEAAGKSVIMYKISGLAFLYLYFQSQKICGMLRLEKLPVKFEFANQRSVVKENPFKVAIKIISEDQVGEALILIEKAYKATK